MSTASRDRARVHAGAELLDRAAPVSLLDMSVEETDVLGLLADIHSICSGIGQLAEGGSIA